MHANKCVTGKNMYIDKASTVPDMPVDRLIFGIVFSTLVAQVTLIIVYTAVCHIAIHIPYHRSGEMT